MTVRPSSYIVPQQSSSASQTITKVEVGLFTLLNAQIQADPKYAVLKKENPMVTSRFVSRTSFMQ